MPKNTFYNLDEEKRKNIVSSIMNELSTASYNEISINKIIKNCGISRGSFYQYFEDKNDMISYFSESHFRMIDEGIKKYLEDNDGDIFSLVEEMLNLSIDMIHRTHNITLIRNITAQYNNNITCSLEFGYARQKKILAILEERANLKLIPGNNEEEKREVVEMIFLLFREAVSKAVFNIEDIERVKGKLIKQLELIRLISSKEQCNGEI